jgi:hypothetical protein
MNNFKNFNNLNSILIVLFTILFCYILFYWIYKSCFGFKIIEGIDGEKDEDKGDDKTSDPKVVTKDSVKKEDEKKKKEASSKDAEKQANAANDKMLQANQNRKDANQPTPPSDKLLQAKFN